MSDAHGSALLVTPSSRRAIDLMTAEERAVFVRMLAAIALDRALEDEGRQRQDDATASAIASVGDSEAP